jgi:hypothetical protein
MWVSHLSRLYDTKIKVCQVNYNINNHGYQIHQLFIYLMTRVIDTITSLKMRNGSTI